MKRLALMIIFPLSVFVASGQNGTSSPYSVFGIGELNHDLGGRNIALGGTGMALRSDLYLNLANPASLTSLPIQSLQTDAGITFKYSHQQDVTWSDDIINGNFSWAALAFPINRTFGVCISLNPVSSVGYTIYSIKQLDGTPYSYPVTFKGEGGLSEASVSIGGLVTKKFSVGLRSSLLWGNTTQSIIDSPPMGSAITRVNNASFIGTSFKPGFQYQTQLNKSSFLTIGGTANLSTYLNGSSDYTVASGSNIIFTQLNFQSQMKLPVDLGLGMALQFREKYLFTADYTRSDWRNSQVGVAPTELTVDNGYHIGLEITPKYDSQRLGQTRRYRIGALYQSGYLVVSGIPITTYAATCGIAVPIRKERNVVNFSMELGRQGTMQNQLALETYVKFNCSFSLWERWFIPRKYD